MTIIENPWVQYRVEGGWADALTGVIIPITGFPTVDTVGVDAIDGWEPDTVVEDMDDDVMFIMEEGAVYEDVQFLNTHVYVRAPHVTLRRCEVIGASVINLYANHVANDFLFEDSTIRYTPPGVSGIGEHGSSIGSAGFTMRRSAIIDVNEGVRTGGSASAGCDLLDSDDPFGYMVRIYDSIVRITGPTPCDFDYHGDAWQCSDSGLSGGGVPCRIRNSRFQSVDQIGDCAGTSCIISGFNHGLPFDIDGLILGGAGYSFYSDIGGDFHNLFFVDDSWILGALNCDEDGWSRVTTWDNVKIVTLDGAGQIASYVATVPLGWDGDPETLDPP